MVFHATTTVLSTGPFVRNLSAGAALTPDDLQPSLQTTSAHLNNEQIKTWGLK